MANIQFNLGGAIALNAMIPLVPGVPTGLPIGIAGNGNAGVYLILNQYANPVTPENRYMGVTTNFSQRFAGRQGACFELGLEQATLNGVNAYLGTMQYQDQGAGGWNNPAGYDAPNLAIQLDGFWYDFEHIFIKGAQHIWPNGTITNTQKTGVLPNLGGFPLTITLTWISPLGAQNANVVVPVAGNLA